jgi:hypothetical protein
MLTRWLVPILVVAGCASVAAPEAPPVEIVPGRPGMVRILLTKEDAFRLSRAGIMDPSSPSGLTDRVRYGVAVDAYVADALRSKGLCPRGYGDLEMTPAAKPFHASITVICLPP